MVTMKVVNCEMKPNVVEENIDKHKDCKFFKPKDQDKIKRNKLKQRGNRK